MFIRKLCDLLKGSVHNLTSLGVPPGSYRKLLVVYWLKKIPYALHLVIHLVISLNFLKISLEEVFAK